MPFSDELGLVWFTGDIARAHESFIRRGGIDTCLFDKQVAGIQTAGLPEGLDATIIEMLPKGGLYRRLEEVYYELFDISGSTLI